jgi:hypothetical protein
VCVSSVMYCPHCHTHTRERRANDDMTADVNVVERLSHGAYERWGMMRPGMAAFSASRPALVVEQLRRQSVLSATREVSS